MNGCSTVRKPLRRVSEKKAARDAEWREISRRILSERPACEAPALYRAFTWSTDDEADYRVVMRALRNCTGRSQEVHHVLQRSLGPTLCDDSMLKALCPTCHRAFVHEHIALAHRLGLLRHSWEAR